MRTNRKTTLLVAVLALLFSSGQSFAAIGSVEAYITLTIERMELTEYLWRSEQKGPSEDQLNQLYTEHATTAEEYLTYGAVHRTEIDAYLRANPDLTDQITDLSTKIETAIQNSEQAQ